MQTQWAVVAGMGGGGRVGLNYASLYPILDRMAKGDEAEWGRLFADIQAMERAVLRIPAKGG